MEVCLPAAAKPHPALILAVLGVLALGSACNLPDFFLVSGSNAQTPVAIFFGIEDYPGGNNDLTLCNDDASSLAARFSALGWETYLYADAACNPTTLATLAATLASASESGRRVLFYYSGHGYGYDATASKAESYMVWWDSAQTSMEFIDAQSLEDILAPLFAKDVRLTLVLDSCNSGGFVFDAAYVDTLPGNYSDSSLYALNSSLSADLRAFLEWFGSSTQAGSDSASTQVFDPSYVWSMSAAGYGEESWESSKFQGPEGSGHGIFTWAVLWGLQADAGGLLAADQNRDGNTSLRELYAYAYAKLDQDWNNTHENNNSQDLLFLPHISANYTDVILFTR